MEIPSVKFEWLKFDEAEMIGGLLHDRLAENGAPVPMTRDDLGWADLVQFVMRAALAAVAERGDVASDDVAGEP